MNKKILIIEDDSDVVEIVKLILEPEHFIVEAVLDPLKAIETAKNFCPDAILLDLTMPKIDGWQIFKTLREDKQFDTVPIAILTAKSQDFDELVGKFVMRADAYIKKPFGKQKLLDQIHGLFKEKK